MVEQPTPAHPATMESQLQTSDTPNSQLIPSAILTTHRLIIRPMHPQDAPSMAHNASDPLLTKYMAPTFPDPYTLTQAETWISINLALQHQDNFVVCERCSPGTVIGAIGLKPGIGASSHTASVGYWMGRTYWGKGYTTEALESFTKWSFENWENNGRRLRRICADVYSGNVASMRCLEKCGYAKEGVLKGHIEKNGQTMDEHLFGLTRSDWEKRMSKVFNNY
ncbi:GCN5-related N-acetyltransferas-like protein [Decorospora gaudefroyi]|uniref:GCN5-related N-acetyltransferas-like protein n=1 Tax=Decorospora gaudefroyi TaxID=184978 RepID=A0A6A5KU62_9PLEO|nr:GCN5-related N-acetyltransferas-like protein [Decorospora gaudefroyi]